MMAERTHIYPINDTREHHTIGEYCPCQPIIEGHLVVHNAYDAREFFEGNAQEALKRLIERLPGIHIRTVTT